MDDLIALALIKHLYATGMIDADDVNAVADDIESQDSMAAHRVRVAMVETHLSTQSDFDARRARKQFHVVTPDGGNAPE